MASARTFRLSASSLVLIAVAALVSQHAQAVKCSSGRGLNGKGQCQLCPLGSYSSGGENALCRRCPDGTTAPLGATSKFNCKKCQGMTFGKGGLCNRCPTGTYVDTWGALQCKKCKKLVGVGHLSTYGCRDYVVCKPGMDSFLKECPTGSCWVDSKQCCVNRKDGKTCVVRLSDTCPAGYGIETDTCEKCRYRYYRPSEASPRKCQLCPPGTEPGANRISCFPCKSLYYNGKPGGSCVRCPVGTYSVQTSKSVGPTKCTPCTKRRLFQDVLKRCIDFVICDPKQRPRRSVGAGCTSPTKQCFNERKQCCENTATKTCVKYFL